jgi:rhamnosyltransferase
MNNIFIIGSKGIPAKYGGFETFVHKLTEKRQNRDIKYYVSCLADKEEEFIYNDAVCFTVKTPSIGSAKAVLYDLKSLIKCLSYIKKNKLTHCVIYILASRIGPFLLYYKRKMKKMNIKLFVNPDGHEWKRSKWNSFIKWYWKFSEALMVKYADLIVCDSKGIESYIKAEYKKYNPKTTFIAYGADLKVSVPDDEKLGKWNIEHSISKGNYYLVVGRFVPENNYETMIREFMKSNTKRDLVFITNVEKNKFFDELMEKTRFDSDPRIKFVGTVYDEKLLYKIREDAFAYIHGHEVGGTNPSLLEALVSTKINLLLDVVFNREVGQDGALYFTKSNSSLVQLINKIEKYNDTEIDGLEAKAKERIHSEYLWEKIINQYEALFITS